VCMRCRGRLLTFEQATVAVVADPGATSKAAAAADMLPAAAATVARAAARATAARKADKVVASGRDLVSPTVGVALS
jgi:hypothetical protein